MSVVTPTYNRADVLGRAIESVRSQTLTDLEHVVVDDGSTDGTPELVRSYDDDRLRYVRLETNRGATVARNRGVRTARGEYVAFLDSDDEALPGRLERSVEAIESAPGDPAGVAHGYDVHNRDGTVVRRTPPTGAITLDHLRDRNSIGSLSATTFRREVLLDVGGFDPSLPASQDFDLYLRVLADREMVGIDDVLLEYYRRDDAITADVERKIRAQERIREKHGDVLSRAHRARQLYARGHLLARTGRMRDACEAFLASLRRDPSLLAAYHAALAAAGEAAFDTGVELKRRVYGALRGRVVG